MCSNAAKHEPQPSKDGDSAVSGGGGGDDEKNGGEKKRAAREYEEAGRAALLDERLYAPELSAESLAAVRRVLAGSRGEEELLAELGARVAEALPASWVGALTLLVTAYTRDEWVAVEFVHHQQLQHGPAEYQRRVDAFAASAQGRPRRSRHPLARFHAVAHVPLAFCGDTAVLDAVATQLVAPRMCPGGLLKGRAAEAEAAAEEAARTRYPNGAPKRVYHRLADATAAARAARVAIAAAAIAAMLAVAEGSRRIAVLMSDSSGALRRFGLRLAPKCGPCVFCGSWKATTARVEGYDRPFARRRLRWQPPRAYRLTTTEGGARLAWPLTPEEREPRRWRVRWRLMSLEVDVCGAVELPGAARDMEFAQLPFAQPVVASAPHRTLRPDLDRSVWLSVQPLYTDDDNNYEDATSMVSVTDVAPSPYALSLVDGDADYDYYPHAARADLASRWVSFPLDG